MANELQTTAVPTTSTGRGLFWLAIVLCLLGIVAPMVAMMLFNVLITPWVMPILTTIGAVLLVVCLAQRKSITRFVTLGLVLVLAALEWYFLVSLAQLPPYQGPAVKGTILPAFQTTLADGSAFSEKNLQDGQPSVMVFFRGRW